MFLHNPPQCTLVVLCIKSHKNLWIKTTVMDERNFAKIKFKTDFVRIFDIVTDPLVRFKVILYMLMWNHVQMYLTFTRMAAMISNHKHCQNNMSPHQSTILSLCFSLMLAQPQNEWDRFECLCDNDWYADIILSFILVRYDKPFRRIPNVSWWVWFCGRRMIR